MKQEKSSSRNIRVGTFNLLNLASAEKSFYGRSYTQDEYQAKKNWLQSQLERMNADIVGFQEIFDEKAIRDVVGSIPMYKDAAIVMTPERPDKPVCGLVSRFPILDVEYIDTFPETLTIEDLVIPINTFSRPLLRVRVLLPNKAKATIWVTHLKSKRPMLADKEQRTPHDPVIRARGQARSLMQRAAEACALRNLLLEDLVQTSNPIMVLGDLNDSDQAVTTQIITGRPPHRNLSHGIKQQAWDRLLYNAKDIVARRSLETHFYTHIHNGHYGCLDHILLSQEFVQENRKHIGRVLNVAYYNDHVIDDTISDECIPPHQSDHGQVVASIQLKFDN